jgi:FKBP-type peptidyl-prolyl cis-trans isomerase
VIPGDLGYGPAGSGAIPPNATLYFDVELVEVVPVVPPQEVADGDYTVTESGLKYYDFVVGSGAAPATGEVVGIDFSFWDAAGVPYGSSAETGQPLYFPVGIDRMFPGLDEGVADMQVGGSRQLYIPAALAAGAGLPPDTDFIFEIDLLSVTPGAPESPQGIAEDEFTITDSGVRYADIVVGDGDELVDGQQVDVAFTAWDENGELLDSSLHAGTSVPYVVGVEQFPGWVDGFVGLRMGGQRQIFVPAEVIGDLLGEPIGIVFEVEILSPSE